MAKRQRADSSDESESESSSDYNPSKVSASKPRKSPQAPKINEKASILSLATNETEIGSDKLKDHNVNKAILARIMKALALGSHPGTGEEEAKRAMRLATKMMGQYNVTQADILAEENTSEKLKRAGQSIVTVRSLVGKRVYVYSWSSIVAWAAQTIFDCKHYTTSFKNSNGQYRVDWTFYGLCEQTAAAALAFEMVYNLVLSWSATKNKKNVYRHGVADGLYKFAKEEQKREVRLVEQKEKLRLEVTRVAEEEKERKRVERLQGPPVRSPSPEAVVPDTKGHEVGKTKRPGVTLEEVPDEDIVRTTCRRANTAIGQQNTLPTSISSASDNHMQPNDTEKTSDDCFSLESPSDNGSDIDSVRDVIDDNGRIEADFDEKDTGGAGGVDIMAADELLTELGRAVNGSSNISATTPINDEAVEAVNSIKEKEQEEEKNKGDEIDTPWSSAQQLTLFRDHALEIAKNYLKEKGLKLKCGSGRTRPALKSAAERKLYNQGKEDSKQIDMKRKRIKYAGDD